jgi:peroxiredoxin
MKIFRTLSILALSFFLIQCQSESNTDSTTTDSKTPSLKTEMKAHNFSLTDQNGNTHSLSDFQGKYVVLEWFNKDCPYVKKHYKSNNMQNLQKKYTDKGVIWLTIISSAKDKQGYLTPDQAKKVKSALGINSTAILFDADGRVGKAYDAKTTPHMYIINPKGNLIYQGAIDDNSSTNPEVIKTSTNYVDQALTEAMNNKPVSVSNTKAYGCSVKYE